MRKLLHILVLAPLLCSADTLPPIEYGVATTVNFVLYNTDGTLDIDEVDAGTEVTLHCDEDAGTTATNDFADEGSYYSLALTAAETECARVVLDVAATDRNVIIVPTHSCHAAADPRGVLRCADAQAGAAGTITLDASASATTDFYGSATYGKRIDLISGTGAGQTRTIVGYNGTSKVADVNRNWDTNPASGTLYRIYYGDMPVISLTAGGLVDANVGDFTAGTLDADAANADLFDQLPSIFQRTTIATLATQVSFTLTAGSSDDDTYNDCTAIVEDSATATQKAYANVQDYTGGTLTVTLEADPGIFTMAVGDNISIVCPSNSVAGSVAVASINAGAITNAAFAGDAIDATVIAANSIGASEMAADSIGASELASDAVVEIRAQQTGTCDSGTTTTCVDAALSEADNDYWQKGMAFQSTSGTTAGQIACIYDFDAASDTLTFRPALTQAITTNTYSLLPSPICGGVVAP